MNGTFRNFTPGLILFGILSLIIAGFLVLGVLGMALAAAMSGTVGKAGVHLPPATMAIAVGWYLFGAAAFATLGVGSMLARR